MSDYTPQPADIILVPFSGPAGPFITALQGLVAFDWSRFSHAAVVLPGERVISAQPGGARMQPLSEVLEQRPCAVLRFPDWGDRNAAICAAVGYHGVPYSFASYLWIGLTRLYIKPKWLRRLVASDKRMICSALADRVWMAGGVHCFNDGRLLGEVTPGDLAYVGDVHNIDTGPYTH